MTEEAEKYGLLIRTLPKGPLCLLKFTPENLERYMSAARVLVELASNGAVTPTYEDAKARLTESPEKTLVAWLSSSGQYYKFRLLRRSISSSELQQSEQIDPKDFPSVVEAHYARQKKRTISDVYAQIQQESKMLTEESELLVRIEKAGALYSSREIATQVLTDDPSKLYGVWKRKTNEEERYGLIFIPLTGRVPMKLSLSSLKDYIEGIDVVCSLSHQRLFVESFVQAEELLRSQDENTVAIWTETRPKGNKCFSLLLKSGKDDPFKRVDKVVVKKLAEIVRDHTSTARWNAFRQSRK
jgi:hypothetical protein